MGCGNAVYRERQVFTKHDDCSLPPTLQHSVEYSLSFLGWFGQSLFEAVNLGVVGYVVPG
jgi:hypothetical protein